MVLYVITLVLGIWLTIRKLDVSRREAGDHPGVDPASFARWKELALGAYNLGSLGCFAKLLFDVLLQYAAPRVGVPWNAIRLGGFLLFVGWVALLVLVWVRASRARKLQESLGLSFAPRPPPDAASD